jgi:hypothetical protein
MPYIGEDLLPQASPSLSAYAFEPMTLKSGDALPLHVTHGAILLGQYFSYFLRWDR